MNLEILVKVENPVVGMEQKFHVEICFVPYSNIEILNF